MRFASVCSGIEAASVAWGPLGWQAVLFAEIDRFPSRVLKAHYPDVPNIGDFTTIDVAQLGSVDILVGGTPCQGFSVAGLRGSLADARSNLALAYAVLAHELARSNGLRNAVWENVPGVLNTDDNAFGCFLGALVGADDALHLPQGIERWPDEGMVEGPRARAAWRILDAQYFGLAQRRRRVFVVVDFGNGADPAEVLFERQGLHGNSPPSREASQGTTSTITASSGKRGGVPQADATDALIASTGDISHCLNAGGMGRQDYETETLVAAYRTSGNCGAWDTGDRVDALTTGTDQNSHIVAFQDRFRGDDGRGYDRPPPISNDVTGALETVKPWAVAYDIRGREGGAQFEGPHDTANMRAASGGSSRSYVAQVSPTLRAGGNQTGGDRPPGTDVDTVESLVAERWAVRRLTPRECERLQGFPDDYTLIPGAADGPRYKALGNSMAVPVMAWIGRRIQDAMPQIAELAAE